LSKQTNNIVANKICVVSKIGLGTGIFGKMAVKGLTVTLHTELIKFHILIDTQFPRRSCHSTEEINLTQQK